MGKKIDLIGQQFGYLTVIEDSGERADGSVVWFCKCKCGNTKKIRARDLKRKGGGTKSCGCLLKEKVSKNLVGQKFGKLIVLEDSGQRDGSEIKWKCQCDCGNICYVVGSSLRDHVTKSCGCIRDSFGEEKIKSILKINNIVFEQEKIFNDCKFLDTNRPARFDFYINNQYIVEFDGIQHFKVTGGWGTKEKLLETQKHDIIKNQYCFKNNIPIIRIPYWYIDNIELKDLLLESSQFIVIKKEE